METFDFGERDIIRKILPWEKKYSLGLPIGNEPFSRYQTVGKL